MSLEERRKELREKIAAAEAQMRQNLLYHFDGSLWSLNPPQAALVDAWKDSRYKVFTFTGANRLGKTTIGVAVACCVLAGEWLWTGEKIAFPH